jgi:cell division septal protein FtsQ
VSLFERSKRRISRKTHAPELVSFKRHFARGLLFLGILSLLVLGIWYGTRLSFLTITDVTVSGGVTVNHTQVHAEVVQILDDSYLLVIPKRFSLFYPHDLITHTVDAIPRVHSVVVERTSFTKLSVTFDEYIPYALWCEHASSSVCYFMNETGYTFAKAPQIDGALLVRYSREGAEELKEGYVIQKEALEEMEWFIEHVQTELALRIGTVTFAQNGDITLSCNGGGLIHISDKNDIRDTFSRLRSVLVSDAFSHIEAGNFKYVDVRFGNKIFVNEEMESISTTTESIYATSTQGTY